MTLTIVMFAYSCNKPIGFSPEASGDAATLYMGVPAMYARLLQAYDGMEPAAAAAAAAAARRLRLMVSGEAPPPSLYF